MTRIVIASLMFIAVACLPTVAGAQSAADSAQARETFQGGVAAAREQRWADAVDLFQQSYELSARPVTMMNLAGALAQLGRLVEAAEAYRSFLAVARTGTAARLRGEADEQLRALEERIPRVRLRILGLEGDDVVRLDEWEVSQAALELPRPVDPGTHQVTIVRAGQERSIPFTAVEGIASEVVLDARAEAWGRDPSLDQVPALALTADVAVTEEPGRSVLEEPVFWIIVGAVVLGGAAIGIGLGVSSQQAGPPYSGNIAPAGVPL